MKLLTPKPKHLWSLSLITIILANFLILQNTLLGIIAGILFIYIYGQKLGAVIFPNFDHIFKTIFGAFSLLLIFTSIFWLNFYLTTINSFVFIFTIIVVPIVIELLYRQKEEILSVDLKHVIKQFSFFGWLYSCIYFLLIGTFFYTLIKNSTEHTIYSPWDFVSWKIFILFALATFFLIKIIFAYKNKFSLLFIFIHFFSITSVALIIYKIGYGYDPFLHLAAIKNILLEGTLSPKPFYYVGEYSLVIFLHQLTLVSIEQLNKLILPVLFSIITPLSIFYGLHFKFNWKPEITQLTSLFILLLPVTFFINTTPQGITNLLALIIIFLSLIPSETLSKKYLIFLSLVTCFFHPFFGVPIFLYSLFIYVKDTNLRKWLSNTIKICLLAISAIIYPLLFSSNAFLNNQNISFNLNKINWPTFNINTQMHAIYDFIYIYINNHLLFIISLAIIATIFTLLYKKNKGLNNTIYFSILTLINFIILKYLINFDFTTSTNQGDFEQRILYLALYFILPTIMFFIYNLIKTTLSEKSRTYKYFGLILIIIMCTITLYISYPVHDNYKNTKSFNISQSDLNTVHWISENSNDNYVVLANQLIGAASIKEYGFKQYIDQEFYYSIPNGNPNGLNHYFESLIYLNNDQEIINDLFNTYNIDTAYFVINDYWTNANTAISEAKKTADHWIAVDNGVNYIFTYNNPTSLHKNTE